MPGIRVGHAVVAGGRSGCTVLLGPFRGAVEVTGMATGTRELGVLDPRSLGARADAVLLTGGSAFGLAAADGVVQWLAEQGLGFASPMGPVPLVPGAVVFDLAEGVPRPDAALGRAAAAAASSAPVPEGRVGAGAGATVGKFAGRDRASPGGLGSAGARHGSWWVGALVVVNAMGNVLDRAGRVVAGARSGSDGEYLDAARYIREGHAHPEARPGTNTTLAVVATDAPFSRAELARVVRVAATALPRRIDPVNTPFDGDTVFALSTAREVAEMSAADSLALGVALRELLEEAITRAVTVDGR